MRPLGGTGDGTGDASVEPAVYGENLLGTSSAEAFYYHHYYYYRIRRDSTRFSRQKNMDDCTGKDERRKITTTIAVYNKHELDGTLKTSGYDICRDRGRSPRDCAEVVRYNIYLYTDI